MGSNQGRTKRKGYFARSYRRAVVRTVLAGSLIAGTFVSAPPTATAQEAKPEPDASREEVVEAARQAFRDKNYPLAIELFERAYEMKSDPAILYNLGVIADQNGQHKDALEYLKRFVTTPGIDIKARDDALKRIDGLEKIVALQEPEPEPIAPAVPEEGPSYIGPIVLMSVGGAVLIAGAAMAGVASSKHDEFESASTLDERRDAASAGEGLALGADVSFGIGGAALAGGLIWMIVNLTSEDSAEQAWSPRVAPRLGDNHAGMGVSMRF